MSLANKRRINLVIGAVFTAVLVVLAIRIVRSSFNTETVQHNVARVIAAVPDSLYRVSHRLNASLSMSGRLNASEDVPAAAIPSADRHDVRRRGCRLRRDRPNARVERPAATGARRDRTTPAGASGRTQG